MIVWILLGALGLLALCFIGVIDYARMKEREAVYFKYILDLTTEGARSKVKCPFVHINAENVKEENFHTIFQVSGSDIQELGYVSKN